MQQMVKLLLGLDTAPSPHDAADALADRDLPRAHAAAGGAAPGVRARPPRHLRSWRAREAVDDLAQTPGAVIAHLTGTLLEKHVQRLVVDVGGVGYDVQVPLSTFYAVGDPGARVRAAHPHARARGRASAVRLRTRRSSSTLFERLIGVSGIGPKVALAVLSGIEPAELVRAIRQAISRG